MKNINIKLLLTVNLINLLILAGTAALFYMEMNIAAIIALVVWVITVIYTNYTIIVKNNDMIEIIRSADRKHKFKNEVSSLIKAQQSIEFHAEFFSEKETGESMKEAYELIAEQISGNINAAVKFMRSYNYITCPSYRFLTDICSENNELLSSLTKLVELTLEIDSAADDVDLSYVDNLIRSLKELTEKGTNKE